MISLHLKSGLVSFVHFFFFGNYFYGLCAVALSIEATLQQRKPLNPYWYFLLVFLVTVLFYTKAYLSERISGDTNPRTDWYAKNYCFVKWSQYIYLILCSFLILIILPYFWEALFSMNLLEWTLILVFPIVANLYYGVDIKVSNRISLRNIGWLKPFFIGFVWAGLVTIYPVIFYDRTHDSHYVPTLIGFLLFIKNLMFIAMLCVLFDIKDYATDSNRHLKTLVVKAGLRKTIFLFVIPLTCLGLGTFIFYGCTNHFQLIKILFNTIPFILLILFAYSLNKPKSILYYLVLIDGLMLVKALCGSVAMIYF